MTADSLIRQHRTADATVTVLAGGVPLANREVVVAQTNHKFRFGSVGFDFIPLANGEILGEERSRMELLAEKWLALFNFATLPFYWGNFEPVRGKPDTARILAAARWFAERGAALPRTPPLRLSETPPTIAQSAFEESTLPALTSARARSAVTPRAEARRS